MICPYCKQEAIWTENKAIYGRNYGKSFMCYYCKPCDAYVGCHENSKNGWKGICERIGYVHWENDDSAGKLLLKNDCKVDAPAYDVHIEQKITEAELRAKLLIYLLENGLAK